MSQKNNQPNVSEEATGGEVSLSDMMRQMAQQNSQLLILLEHFTGNQQEAPPQRSAPEKILESLASNVKEFHFDPENGLTFDRWFSKYEDLFRQDGRDLDDAAKLKQIFGQQKSLFSKRYDCLKLEKNETDDFVSYARIVNRQCEDFELQKLTVNQFKSLVFICGLKSAKDADVRTRLLAKLESDQADTINLEGLVTECQRLSNLKHDTALVEKKLTSSTVQAVRHTKQPNNQTKSSADGKSPPSPCWQCGAMHFVKDCQFSKHFCKQCGEIGHKGGYCGCFATPSSSKSVGDKKKKSCSTKVIQTVQQVNSRRKYISVIFNKTVAKLQLDCGSDITVISHTTWKTIGSPSFSTISVEASTAFQSSRKHERR
ncbi:uncharacterized protein K02A2.6-like [Armigeres subalbatus]|uniref:uncharacterized protein K02A2.6-like n=1 Tax=Armigeres subalbatus TaxID=124917 RepID=UPI002ED223E1